MESLLEEAMRIGALCDSVDVDMVLITGSVARGLADESSDIDVYVYVSADSPTVSSLATTLQSSGATRVFGLRTPTGMFEKFRLAERFVDVEQISTGTLTTITDRIAAAGIVASDVKVAAGIRDAVAVVGARALRQWQARLVLTDEVARAELARLSPSLLSPRALYGMTWARSDELSFAARVSTVLLAGVGILGAVNRRWITSDDPKWLPWQIEQLQLRPRDAMPRLRNVMTNPTVESTDDGSELLSEILDLADAHIEGADTRAARFALRLRP